MPLENLEEESLAKNPNLDYAQWKFMLTTSEYRNSEEIKSLLLKAIKENNMAPFYIEVNCKWHFILSNVSNSLLNFKF